MTFTVQTGHQPWTVADQVTLVTPFHQMFRACFASKRSAVTSPLLQGRRLLLHAPNVNVTKCVTLVGASPGLPARITVGLDTAYARKSKPPAQSPSRREVADGVDGERLLTERAVSFLVSVVPVRAGAPGVL